MRVEDFPRPKNDNRRGVHWSASVYHPTGAALDFWIGELRAMNIKWVKLLDDGGGSSLELCQRLLGADIMPVVRVYRLEPNPGHIGGREEETIRRLVGAGVRYIETNNEPDLPAEWKGGRMPSNWLDVMIDNFIYDADKVISLGGLPALPAMGVGAKDNPVEAVVRKGRGDLFRSGAWIAIHNYTLNHPLDYPYDAVNQEGAPVSQQEYDRLGQWAWESRPREMINEWRQSDKNPGDTLADDPVCFLAFHLIDEIAQKLLGQKVPIISTEGGPVVGWKDDRRYPRVDPWSHAESVVAINDFMQGRREIHGIRCPENYFTMCHWLLANYRLGFMAPGWESQSWYTDWWNTQFSLTGEMPVVAAVKGMPNVSVDQSTLSALGGKVLRADTDEPLADVLIKLMSGRREVATTTTAADGSFRLEKLPPGTYDIEIAPWGVVRRGVVATPGTVPPLTIRLTGGRSSVISGRVTDAAGAARSGVKVTLSRDGKPVGESLTGNDGTFRFEALPLGTYRIAIPGITVAGIAVDGWAVKNLKLSATPATRYRYAVTQRRLLSPEETAGRNILFGTVSDASGAGANGIKVRMAWEGADPGTQFPDKLSGHDPFRPAGRYEFTHTPGNFRLEVAQGDWPSEVADGLLTAGVPGRQGQPIAYQVDFRLLRAENVASVDGVVIGGEAGRKLLLEGPSGKLDGVLDPQGAFAFQNLAPGDYKMWLDRVGLMAGDITVEAASTFTLIYPMRSKLSGRVVGQTEGLVAVLYALSELAWTRQVPLEPDGSFSINDLPAGRYRLEVADLVLPDLELNGENRLQLAPIDLAQGTRGAVRGRVADGAGRAQSEVVMVLRREGLVVAQAPTTAEGDYRFGELPSGVYSLEAVGMGQVANAMSLDGQRELVSDVLWAGSGPRSAIQGRVLTAEGRPQRGAGIRLLRDGSEVAHIETDDGGLFRFPGLSGGSYALALDDADTVEHDIELEEDATVFRDVNLIRGPAKDIAHYFLFSRPALDEANEPALRLALTLAMRYMARLGATGGFDLTEALHAGQVTVVGDSFGSDVEGTLRAAGCHVTRLPGDGFALASVFDQLLAKLGEG